MAEREFKSTPFALFKKDKLGERSRAGVFAVLGNRDSVGDRIMPGAFTKTFAEQKRHARHLWNHNFDDPPTAKVNDLYEISKGDLPEEVLQFAPDALGGAVVVRTYLDTPRGNEVLTALDAGAIDEMSFAYKAVKCEYANEDVGGVKVNTRIIREVRHYESSDVLWGINPATMAQMSATGLVAQLKALLADVKAGRADSAALAEVQAICKELFDSQPQQEQQQPETAQDFTLALSLASARLRQFEVFAQGSRAGF